MYLHNIVWIFENTREFHSVLKHLTASHRRAPFYCLTVYHLWENVLFKN